MGDRYWIQGSHLVRATFSRPHLPIETTHLAMPGSIAASRHSRASASTI
jgi:hypothetical protein